MMDLEREVSKYFKVYSSEVSGDTYRFYVLPIADSKQIKAFLARLSQNYDVSLRYVYGEMVLELKKAERKERVWVNIVLLVATVATTTLVGSTFYGEELNLVGGLMFSLAIMFVLGSHEMGHYFAAKRWKMRTSLPYFIPFPTIIGTLGAIIKHRGAIPNRKALFDVGVSGPLAGVAASLIVVSIGLTLPFELKGKPTLYIGTPLIFDAVIYLMNYTSEVIHPVAFAGWVGFFVTFLNMIPVGQLDGGHVLRAMLGRRADAVSRAVPFILILYGLYLSEAHNLPGNIWLFWGMITFFFSHQRHPEPVDDETPLDAKRYAVGILSLIIAALCFTPVPFYYSL